MEKRYLTYPYKQKLYDWWNRKPPREALLDTLAEAQVFEEWEAAAFRLDEILGYDLWYMSIYVKRDYSSP